MIKRKIKAFYTGSHVKRKAFHIANNYFRWRFLLSISLVYGLYIVTGFLINFKEFSRIWSDCCEFHEPFNSKRQSCFCNVKVK